MQLQVDQLVYNNRLIYYPYSSMFLIYQQQIIIIFTQLFFAPGVHTSPNPSETEIHEMISKIELYQ